MKKDSKKYIRVRAGEQRTDMVYGVQNVIDTVIEFASIARIRIDACVDYTRPSLAVDIDLLRKYFRKARKRGVKLRYVTEITKQNLIHSKKLMGMVDELRHLDGIKGNFYLSENEYLAPATKHGRGKPASELIRSSTREILTHQQYVFNSFWNAAIPAQQKILEIERGKLRHETKLLHSQEEIIDKISHMAQSSTRLSIVSGSMGMEMIYDNFFDLFKRVLSRKRRIPRMRWTINVTRENGALVKLFMNMGIEVRHIKNTPPMNFAVGDKELYAMIAKEDGGKIGQFQSLLTSNDPAFLEHFSSIFEELWRNGIDSRDRIKDIESGVGLGEIEVIQNASLAGKLYLNIVKSASKEVMILFPSVNAFHRQEKLGVIKILVQKVQEDNIKSEYKGDKLNVRILVPSGDLFEKSQDLRPNTSFHVRTIERPSDTKATLLIADRKVSLIMEIKDDTKNTFDEAIGLSTYSNSKAGVLSLVSIFENFWTQAELYQEVKEANMDLETAIDELKLKEEMQRDFINIAAHELRSPIQPIIGLTQILRSKSEGRSDKDQYLIDTITRNAIRLKHVAENLLDVSRIENETLRLNKEIFDIDELISGSVQDFITGLERSGKSNAAKGGLKLSYQNLGRTFVNADKHRLAQVVSNLLNNAIVSTGGSGTISVKANKSRLHGENDKEFITITVKDTGRGIASDMFPKLFSKFATKSEFGTGLGLYISKNIVESHEGKIWAQNNQNQIGATFAFSLPVHAA